jgi:hypothetical protein
MGVAVGHGRVRVPEGLLRLAHRIASLRHETGSGVAEVVDCGYRLDAGPSRRRLKDPGAESVLPDLRLAFPGEDIGVRVKRTPEA